MFPVARVVGKPGAGRRYGAAGIWFVAPGTVVVVVGAAVVGGVGTIENNRSPGNAML
jgi:hypothetical protein